MADRAASVAGPIPVRARPGGPTRHQELIGPDFAAGIGHNGPGCTFCPFDISLRSFRPRWPPSRPRANGASRFPLGAGRNG